METIRIVHLVEEAIGAEEVETGAVTVVLPWAETAPDRAIR